MWPKHLNVLHDAFFLSDRKTVNVFLAGTGLIGKALLKQVNEQFKKLQEENKLEVRITGMANSKKMIFSEDGLSFVNAVENLKEKGDAYESSGLLSKNDNHEFAE
jgi:aspartokinase/homoserine dehydrogenase 1